MKYIFYVIVSVLFLSCSSNKQTESEGQAKTLPVLILQKDSIIINSEYPARIEGKVNVDIRSQTEGYLEKILVEEGSFVKAGQSLFKIDDKVYNEQLNTAIANLETAELDVEKYTLLSESNVTSDFQLKEAKAKYESAKASVESAKINMNFTLIKAPVSGFIGRIPKRVGNLISRSDTQALTTLSDISEVYAYFSMTEKDFLLFNKQNEGTSIADKIKKLPQISLILADGDKYPLQGVIQMINGEFDSSIGSISMRGMFKNPESLLRTGNTGRIVIPRMEKDVILVPVLSTLDIQDKILVVRLTAENKAERVAITIRGKQGDYYIVQSGLTAGDRIVSQEIGSVQDGETIQPEIKK